jgi:hypothetical protein
VSEPGDYSVLECWEDDQAPPHVSLREVPEFENVSWISGLPIERSRVPRPIRVEIEGDADDVVPPIIDEGIPLWRDDLIAALSAAGADNFETFEVEILDTRTNRMLTNFKALNVIGMVAAADLGKSQYVAHGEPVVDVDFNSLAIAPEKTRGLAMFRLAECVTALVIHSRVRDALSRFEGLSFVPPEDWIG